MLDLKHQTFRKLFHACSSRQFFIAIKMGFLGGSHSKQSTTKQFAMKKLTLLFICFLILNLVRGQIMQETVDPKSFNPDLIGNIRDVFLSENSNPANISSPKTQEYYERLFYTCKVWGYVKYFHSATANCSINLDSILIQKLPFIETAAGNTEFNQILLDLINSPGEPALPTIHLPVVPDSLKYNLNLDWFHDEVFSQPVKDALDTIRSRFRPRPHCLVGVAFYNGNPTFDNDILYNSNNVLYPEESLRILALFRYWNVINYFYPYKNILDQDWDGTLTEILPLVTEAPTATEYNLALLVLAKRINDSHAFTTGGMLTPFFGTFFPRFTAASIQNETVITKVHSSVFGIKAGDIIRSVDGIEIAALRDSIAFYTKGSNEAAVSSNVIEDILLGPNNSFNISVENENGISEYTLQRNWSPANFFNFQLNTGPVWFDTIMAQGCNFGYVDMARLTATQVGNMMTSLWNTDAIVFDLRNYPQGTLWTLVNYLFTQPIHIASFTVPDRQYPGTLYWYDELIGSYPAEVYTGKVIILFDIRTISQAEYTCMGLEQHPGSIKIGSQTKAADGNVSMIYLPGNITTYFTGLGTFYPDYSQTQRIGIVPDIEIKPTIEGIRQGKDEVLDYAFNCALVSVDKLTIPTGEMNIFPNPFNNSTRLEYSLPQNSDVTIEIHDMNGKIVSTFLDETQPAGKYSIEFDGSAVPTGVFYCRLKTGNQVMTKKIIKVR
jgi:C-terminal processing protease CtpA/Prc